MDFQELKDELLERAKEKGACIDGYKQGMNAKDKNDLLKAITGNFEWVYRNKVVDSKLLEENFTPEELWEHGIYTSGQNEVRGNNLIFACGSATVKAYGSATVKAYGSATVEAYGSATVKACGSDTVKAYDSATVEAYGSATVEAYGSATVKAYGSATVEAYGSATVKAYSNSYVENCTGNVMVPQSDYAIVKDYYKHKLYVKKGKLEIIEIE